MGRPEIVVKARAPALPRRGLRLRTFFMCAPRLPRFVRPRQDVDRPVPGVLRARLARAACAQALGQAAVGGQRVELRRPAPPAWAPTTSPFSPSARAPPARRCPCAVSTPCPSGTPPGSRSRSPRSRARSRPRGSARSGRRAAPSSIAPSSSTRPSRPSVLDRARAGAASSSPSPAILTPSERSFISAAASTSRPRRFSGVQARDREDVVAVAVGAVGPLGRRRVEELAAGCRRSAAAAPGSCATGRPGASRCA